MVLLAPTVTALQTLLEVGRSYAGPHDIAYNTTKTVCILVRPKQSQGGVSTKVRLGNEEHSFVKEFRYLGHIMTADSRDDKDIKNNSGGKMQLPICFIRKLSFRVAVATRQVPVDCRQPIWFQASTWDRNGHFCTKANSRFLL